LKIQDVLANVGGFMDLIILIFTLTNFYALPRLDYYLFNHCVEVKFEGLNNKSKKFVLNKKTSVELHNRDLYYDEKNNYKNNNFNDQNQNNDSQKSINNNIDDFQDDKKHYNNVKNIENKSANSIESQIKNFKNYKKNEGTESQRGLVEYSMVNLNNNSNNHKNLSGNQAESQIINDNNKKSEMPVLKKLNVSNFAIVELDEKVKTKVENINNNIQNKEYNKILLEQNISNLVAKKKRYLTPSIYDYYFRIFCSNCNK